MAPIGRQKIKAVAKRAGKKDNHHGYPVKSWKMIYNNLQFIILVFILLNLFIIFIIYLLKTSSRVYSLILIPLQGVIYLNKLICNK